LGDTISNWETSKLGRVSSESREDIDLDECGGEVPFKGAWRIRGDESIDGGDDILCRCDCRYSFELLRTPMNCSGICGLGGTSGEVTDALPDPNVKMLGRFRSVLDRGSGVTLPFCSVLLDVDFHDLRIDFRTPLGFSCIVSSGGGGTEGGEMFRLAPLGRRTG
jgi:hypothetical protein